MRGSIFSTFRSRPSSPAPTSRPDSGVFVNDMVDPLSLPPPQFGSGVQTNPGPSTGPHRARPITRLSLTPFRRASPSPAPPISSTPSPSLSPNLMSYTPPPVAAPGASYLDNLSLKLGEAVQKALLLPLGSSPASTVSLAKSSSIASLSAGKSTNGLGLVHHHGGHGASPENVVLKGKKPVPSGRGRVLGSLISSELYSAAHVLHDTYLHRAILRLLQRPLTNLLTNLSQCVTALILAPEFAPSVPLVTLNPTQIHALAYAGFASELLETFDALNLGRSSSHLQSHGGAAAGGDGLKPIKEGLENVIAKVVGPLLAAIKAELAASIDELEQAGKTLGADAGTAVEKLEHSIYRVGGLVTHITFVPSEQQDGVCRQSTYVQTLLATFEIGTMWTCLKALAARKLPPPAPAKQDQPLKNQASEGSLSISSAESMSSSSSADLSKLASIQLPLSYVTPPGTPHMVPLSSPNKPEGREPKRSSTLGILGLGNNKSSTKLASAKSTPALASSKLPTPAVGVTKLPTPPGTTKFSLSMLPSLKVNSTPSSRAPSPPHDPILQASANSSPTRRTPPAIPVPNPQMIALQLLAHDARILAAAIKRAFPLPSHAGLAREAVQEAAEKMDGFVALLEYAKEDGGRHLGISPVVGGSGGVVDVEALMDKTRQAPMLLVLPILLRIWNGGEVGPAIGLAEDEYERSCLGAFGKAEECEAIVGRALLGSKVVRCVGWFRDWIGRCVEEAEDGEDEG